MPVADAYIVAVPTPFTDGHKADLSYIRDVAGEIASKLVGGELIILESTSPPGTTVRMAKWILDLRPDLSLNGEGGRPIIHIAHCPERVLPGKVMVELVTNDRIVGGLTTRAAERARSVYQEFCQGEVLLTDAVTAETAKLVENAFRDVNIAFANELSYIADSLEIDVWELIRLANHHPRVNILQPGPGVGGHCIAVDPWFIVEAAPESSRLIRAAREVNDSKPRYVVAKAVERLEGKINPRVVVLGLAFKPDIDDLRESPACQIVEDLAGRLPGASIMAIEPHVTELPPRLAACDNVALAELEDDVLESADLILALVPHTLFSEFAAERGHDAVSKFPVLSFVRPLEVEVE
jgi:UDP-N-acetyl-D-mannosaminuronic acid dehydrogenase